MSNNDTTIAPTEEAADVPDQQDQEQQQDDGDGAPATTQTRAKTRRRQKQISAKSINWNIPANHQVALHAKSERGYYSWQYRVLKFLHGHKVQIFLASLLFLDVLILFCELALLTIYPSCHLVERDAISCCPIVQEEEHDDAHLRFLEGDDHHGNDDHHFCAPGLQAMEEYEAGCDEHKWERVHRTEMALLSLTLFILSVFFIELTVTMIALTPQVFFRQIFYTLDYFIVTVSLGLEITFVQLDDEFLASLIGLVIMGRLWRFVRIGHGIVELSEDIAHDRETRLLIYAEELEDLLKQHDIPLPQGDLRPSSHSNSDVLERLEKRHRDKEREHYRKKKSSAGSS